MIDEEGQHPFAPTLKKILDQRVILVAFGKSRRVTKLEAILERLARRAASADKVGINQLVELISSDAFRQGDMQSKPMTPEEGNDKLREIFGLPKRNVDIEP